MIVSSSSWRPPRLTTSDFHSGLVNPCCIQFRIYPQVTAIAQLDQLQRTPFDAGEFAWCTRLFYPVLRMQSIDLRCVEAQDLITAVLRQQALLDGDEHPRSTSR